MRIPIFAGKFFKRFSADGHLSFLRTERADKHIDNRGFSATAFAHDRRHSFFGERHIHVFKHFSLSVVRERNVFQPDIFVAVKRFRSPFGIGRI